MFYVVVGDDLRCSLIVLISRQHFRSQSLSMWMASPLKLPNVPSDWNRSICPTIPRQGLPGTHFHLSPRFSPALLHISAPHHSITTSALLTPAYFAHLMPCELVSLMRTGPHLIPFVFIVPRRMH